METGGLLWEIAVLGVPSGGVWGGANATPLPPCSQQGGRSWPGVGDQAELVLGVLGGCWVSALADSVAAGEGEWGPQQGWEGDCQGRWQRGLGFCLHWFSSLLLVLAPLLLSDELATADGGVLSVSSCPMA